jgi:predicted transcriptional regulator
MERGSASEKIRRVYEALKTTEPQTPNEIALTLEMNQKTVQSILLELVNTTDDVNWKKIGRYRIFWKACKDAEGTP